MRRFLIASGLILLLLGVFQPYVARLGLGSLPGDLEFKGEHMTVSFPIVTCLVLSLGLSAVMWVVRRFF